MQKKNVAVQHRRQKKLNF